MSNTALNRTTQAILTNKSGGNLNYGDVVVLDNTNDNGFTTTTSAGLSTRGIGVILEPNGIANNASGMVAVGGWCPKINLNTSATDGQFIKTHTVAGQGTPHASPQVEGDFAVALTASATPSAILFGSPNGPSSGGSGTVTHTAGALTLGQLAYGNASADIKVVAATDGQIPIGKSSDGTAAFATLTAGTGGSVTNAANAVTVGPSTNTRTRQITYIANGGGSALTATSAFDAYVQCEYGCTITANTVLADQSGSVQIAITKSTYSGFPGSLASIVASAPPTLSTAQKSTDSTLTGWTTSVAAGDVLHFSLTSVATITFCQLALTVTTT